VAVSNETVVGFALGSSLEKRGSAWRYGYLEWIGVDPSMNGQGIGKRLLNRLTERFIKYGARMMLVDTDMENQAAIRFFKAHGFGNAAPHVYMSRNLTAHPDYVRKKSRPEDIQAAVPHQRRDLRVREPEIAAP
jgi:ribosomal protein S18 acetylase RimI-like enzyme